jgi:hypothetical protein
MDTTHTDPDVHPSARAPVGGCGHGSIGPRATPPSGPRVGVSPARVSLPPPSSLVFFFFFFFFFFLIFLFASGGKDSLLHTDRRQEGTWCPGKGTDQTQRAIGPAAAMIYEEMEWSSR